MHFSIPAESFRELLALAKAVAPSKPSLPVLSSIHCRVTQDGSQLVVTSTNLDLGLIHTIPLEEPGGPGEICLYIAALASIRPDKRTPVRIDVTGSTKADFAAVGQYVTQGHSASFSIGTIDPEEFPALPVFGPEEMTVTLPRKTLDAIATSIPFQSKDDTRYVLNGAYLDPADGGVVVATDGRRLFRLRTKVPSVPIILPRAACELITRIKPNAASVGLHAESGHICFRLGSSFTVCSTLIDGNFPNYRQVIPPAADSKGSITFTDAEGVASWLSTLKGDLSVTLRPRPPHFVDLIHEHGSLVTPAYLEGDRIAIAFNPAFLAECLRGVGGTLDLTDHMSPGIFRSPDAIAVIMPVRVASTEPATTPES